MSEDKISIKQYQEIDFNIDYIKNSKNQLTHMINHIKNIVKGVDNLERDLNYYLKSIKKCFTNLSDEIYSCLLWLNITKNFNDKKNENIIKHNDFIKNIHKSFQICNDFISKVNKNDYMSKINGLNLKLKNSINDIIELQFYPPKCQQLNIENSIVKLIISDMSIKTSYSQDPYDEYDNYYNNYINANSRDYAEVFGYLDQEQNVPFNDPLYEDIKINRNLNNKESKKELSLNKESKRKPNEELNENIDEINDDRNDNFLKCMECQTYKAINKCSDCGKIYCKGCTDYILKYDNLTTHKIEKIPTNQLELETAKNLFLKNFISFFKNYLLKCNYLLNLNGSNKNFDFPSIEDINNFESQLKYLKQINKICPNLENYEDNDDKNLKINANLIISLENIFKEKKLHLSDNISDIDEDFFSEEVYKVRQNELFKIKNNLLYFINVISKENIPLDKNLSFEIQEEISEKIEIEKNNIFVLLNHKPNNFIKSEQFTILPQIEIQNLCEKNPILNSLKEVKNIIKYFKDSLIPGEYLDFRGNTINPNLSNNLIRGNEIYDPPYGWFGIGLNVEKIYGTDFNSLFNNKNSNEWAIAYHGITSKLSSDKIMKLIRIIITNNGIKIGKSKMKSNCNDIRHWGKVGEGIYLIPKIKIAEHFTGIISFNNKKYKVLFMAKVYTKAIREPENTNFWVLDEKYIRIYRILFKEIK